MGGTETFQDHGLVIWATFLILFEQIDKKNGQQNTKVLYGVPVNRKQLLEQTAGTNRPNYKKYYKHKGYTKSN